MSVENFKREKIAKWKKRSKGTRKPEAYFATMLGFASSWSDGDWAALENIEREFGSLWGGHIVEDIERKKEITRRQVAVGRKIQRMPRIVRNGIEYDAPYSFGLHLAALREMAPDYRPHILDEVAL